MECCGEKNHPGFLKSARFLESKGVKVLAIKLDWIFPSTSFSVHEAIDGTFRPSFLLGPFSNSDTFRCHHGFLWASRLRAVNR